ncbi:MAG: FAD-dependent oxidoreductase [Opitutaceae bacterium]
MDLISGRPFWPIKSGLLQSFPPLLNDASCEVAVIGGGITGALVAHQLVSAGVDTLLLDKRDIGFGSTAASTGFLSYENDVPLHRLIGMIGEEKAVRSYQVSFDAVRKFKALAGGLDGSSGYVQRESLYLASSERDLGGLRTEFETRRRCGFDVEWCTKADLARHTTLPHWGAILTRDTAQIDTYRFTNALLARASRKGLRAFDRTAVTRHLVRPRGVELLTERGTRVRARQVVVATGYEALSDLRGAPTSLHSTYAIVSEPLTSFAGWPRQRMMWETARPYLYLRATEDGRAMLGGYDEPFRDPRRRDELLTWKTQLLARKFKRILPKIDFEVAYAWTGTFAETPDGLPYIGEHPDHPRMYFALGYGGNGITYGFIAAEIITALCLGRKNPDAGIFRFGR